MLDDGQAESGPRNIPHIPRSMERLKQPRLIFPIIANLREVMRVAL